MSFDNEDRKEVMSRQCTTHTIKQEAWRPNKLHCKRKYTLKYT